MTLVQPATTLPARRPTRSRSDRRKGLAVLVTGLATLLVVLTLGALQRPAVDRLSVLVFDFYQRLLPRPEAGAPIAIVDIDEASIGRLGQWPWPRTTIAELVERLSALGAVTIAFDIVFPDPDRTSLEPMVRQLRSAGAEVRLPQGAGVLDNDGTLAATLARHSVTIGIAISNEIRAALPAPKSGFAYGGADPKTYLPAYAGGVVNLQSLTDAARGMGSFSFPPSSDGIVRTIPLISSAGGQLYPALGIEALRVAQGASSISIRSTGASGEADTGRPAMVALRVGDLSVPTGAMGEFWIYFSGLASVTAISAAELLDPARAAELADRVAGRIVLVGTSAVGLRDLVTTPTGASLPGVFVHAEIIDQIVGQVFLTRPDWAGGAELVVAAALGLLLLAVARRGSAIASSGAALVLLGLACASSWWAFAGWRLLLDPLLPVVAVALVFAVTMPLLLQISDRERQFIRTAFGRYLAPTLVERLASNPENLVLGGELRELTVLFSDIRGFTSLSEELDPQALTRLLNGFLTPMTDILLRSEATIDKYMGDAIMAFWNAPLDIPDHARKACLAALEMTRQLDALNAGRERRLAIGIGLHSGPCCVGNLGSAQRFSYSAIGDGVNLASRIEGLTKTYGVDVLATDATRAGASELAFLEIDLVRVVGRRQPVGIHVLLGDAEHARTPEFAGLLAAHGELIAAYRAGDVERAGLALAEAAGRAPPKLRQAYGIYEERLATMRLQPPPKEWDGVYTARRK